MLRFILALTALAAAPAAQADEVTDVLLLRGDQQLWIALEGEADALRVDAGAGTLTLRLAGFQPARARRIAPAANAAITAISVQPVAMGADIVIEGGFAQASAELRQGGVLIGFTQGRSRVMAASPEPGRTPEPGRSAEPSTAIEAPNSTAMGASSIPSPGDQAAPASFRIGPPVETEDAVSRAPIVEPRPTPSSASAQPAASPSAAAPVAEAGQPESVQSGTVQSDAEVWRAEPDLPGPCDASAATVASSPWDLDALTVHAGCLVEIGEIDNGAGLYERVLAFEPSHFQAALGLARIRERQGRRADAARLFETAANSALTDGQALAARQAARRLRGEN